MRRSFLHNCVAFALIGLWIAPGAGALAVGLHRLEHHRPEHRAEHHRAHEGDSYHHDSLAYELAVAATHGHHHDSATVPDHDHSVFLEGVAQQRPGTTTNAVAPLKRNASPWRDPGGSIPGTRYRSGSAAPLFYAHCSLLL